MATAEGTERYARKFTDKQCHDSAFRQFGSTGLTVSAVGFGGYRVHHDSQLNTASLKDSLLNGVNIVDTSSNYSDGGSEELIGKIFTELTDEGAIARDEIVIVSKVGYIQGRNMKIAEERKQKGNPFPETVEFMKEAWHCMHPEFLEDQLERSLGRLGLDTIDVYLLHNPEYYLQEAEKEKKDIEEARTEYYRRIGEAFRWMEEKAAEGKISYFGISSNTFVKKSSAYDFTSIERVLEAAEAVSKDHRFRVVQFPLNLFEKKAATLKNHENDTKTVLEYAAENNFAAMANRPLNAVKGSKMVRLASFASTDTVELKLEFRNNRDRLAGLEDRFAQEFVKLTPRDIPNENFIQVFTLASQLKKALDGGFESREQWDHILQNMLLPQSMYFLEMTKNLLKDNADFQQWADNYKMALLQFLKTISRYYDSVADERSQKINAELDKLDGNLKSSPTLSQKAIRTYTSLPGVDTVLVGMRRPEYVKDTLQVLSDPPVADARKVIEEFSFKL